MTNEQFEKLLPYETNMRTAMRFSYSRAMTNAQLEELAVLYEEITGTAVHYHHSCRQCDRLALLKKVGKLFFEHKEEMEKQAAAPPVPAEEQKVTKKRTRKPKKEE
ncbi:MAG: hypothetical protein LUG98_11600 [Tannerellaceae bacterium]|nr:hypothetical protein [Tannerellaceae bacterium]